MLGGSAAEAAGTARNSQTKTFTRRVVLVVCTGDQGGLRLLAMQVLAARLRPVPPLCAQARPALGPSSTPRAHASMPIRHGPTCAKNGSTRDRLRRCQPPPHRRHRRRALEKPTRNIQPNNRISRSLSCYLAPPHLATRQAVCPVIHLAGSAEQSSSRALGLIFSEACFFSSRLLGMAVTSVFFGSIGVLAETSDIQRQAYNCAFEEAGLSWHWDRSEYRELLKTSGGLSRLARLNEATNAGLTPSDISGIHQRKTQIACETITKTRVPLRPGVAELVQLLPPRGIKLALVTTTYPENVEAIADAQDQQPFLENFACVLTIRDVKRGKPAPDVYLKALAATGTEPDESIAIEDTTASVISAKSAGLRVIATPGALTDTQDFSLADLRLRNLSDEAGELDVYLRKLLAV